MGNFAAERYRAAIENCHSSLLERDFKAAESAGPKHVAARNLDDEIGSTTIRP